MAKRNKSKSNSENMDSNMYDVEDDMYDENTDSMDDSMYENNMKDKKNKYSK